MLVCKRCKLKMVPITKAELAKKQGWELKPDKRKTIYQVCEKCGHWVSKMEPLEDKKVTASK